MVVEEELPLSEAAMVKVTRGCNEPVVEMRWVFIQFSKVRYTGLFGTGCSFSEWLSCSRLGSQIVAAAAEVGHTKTRTDQRAEKWDAK